MSVVRLLRVMGALEQGAALRRDDASWLLLGFRRAIIDAETTIEHGFDLLGRWRASVRKEERRGLQSNAVVRAGSVRAAAHDLWRALINYRKRHYEIDMRATKPPAGVRGEYFRILQSHGGKVPSERTLRRLLSSGPKSPLNLAHGVADDVIRKPEDQHGEEGGTPHR